MQSTASDAETKSDSEIMTETEKNQKTETAPESNSEDVFSADSVDEKTPYDNLAKIAVIILAAILICTIPALIFRFVFTNGGIGKSGAKILAFFYTIGMTWLFYYIVTKYKELNLSLLICLVPLIWSFVVYKIVKR